MDVKALALGLLRSKTAWGGFGQWLLVGVLAALDSGQPLGIWIGLDRATAQGFRLELPAVLFAVGTALLGLVLWGRKTASGPLGEAAGKVAAELPAESLLEQFSRKVKDYGREVERVQPSLVGMGLAESARQHDACLRNDTLSPPSETAETLAQDRLAMLDAGLSRLIEKRVAEISAKATPPFGPDALRWADQVSAAASQAASGQTPAAAPATTPVVDPVTTPVTKPEGGSHA